MDSAVTIDNEPELPFLGGGVLDWENDPLATLLVNQGKIKEHELRQIQGIHSSTRHEALGIALIRYGLLSDEDLANTLSEVTGLKILHEEKYNNINDLHDNLSLRFMKSVHAVPLSIEDKKLYLAMAEPRDIETINSVSVVTELEVVPQLGLCSHIQQAIKDLEQQGVEADPEGASVSELTKSTEIALRSQQIDSDAMDVAQLRDLASEAPTIRTVNQLLHEAIQINASDIHFEPGSDGLRVRYRVDGVLRLATVKPLQNAAAICSRLKIMAKLDIAERRMPQDGRIQLKISGKELDIRMSTIPTLFGENIVIRLLDKSNVILDFDHLGFNSKILAQFKTLLSAPHGIFLVTGPTGCGKTTSLYTALNQINSIERKLVTVEDPIEYQLEGVNQIAVQPKIGLSFDRVLRSILRQDPDVIMIGEMRDTETARIAVQAALTGHLVLSTLHTNDAVTGITRLLDMGVEDYLLASTLNGVLAQRLVRRLCNHCKRPDNNKLNEYTSVGCFECGNTGYSGRIAITELLIINDEFRELIVSKANRNSMKSTAEKVGMQTLYDCGMHLVNMGVTSRIEILKVANEL